MTESTLFIPDISGFTRFVKSTEISHGRHIIEEIINLIVKEGMDVFEVAEIEGDAVFFFKHEEKLSVEQIIEEAKKIFTAFHKHLLLYEYKRICNCGACSTAINLKLKFVVHSGEIELASFTGEKGKPYGGPVIAVHRLLKNKIGHNEYVLLSNDFLGEHDLKTDGESFYEDKELGKVGFQYVKIEDWKEGIEFEEDLSSQIDKADIEVVAKQTIPFPIDLLHNFISDFRYRKLWNKEADEIIYDGSKINNAGNEHYCVINGKNLYFDTTKPQSDPNQRTYGEILKNPAPFKHLENNFIMTPVNDEETVLEFRFRASVKWLWQRPLIPKIRKSFESKAKEILSDIAKSLEENVEKLEEALS